MRRFNSKSIYILSTLLLSYKPLTITEIAKQTGYLRQTLDPYITNFVVAGYITNVGRSSRYKWVIPENCKQHVLDIVINNDVAPSRRILNALEQKYGRNKWVHLEPIRKVLLL
jgi:predicted transcriptional regulator